MGLNALPRVYYLLSAFLAFTTTVSAQADPFSSTGGGLPSLLDLIFGNYINFDADLTIIAANLGTFLLLWIITYIILSITVKLAAENSPGDIGDTIQEVLLGEGGDFHNPEGGRNLLLWISGLVILSMGPFIGDFILAVQSQILLYGIIAYWVFLVAVLLLIGLAVTFMLGQAGTGGAYVSNVFASGASSFWNSDSVQAGRRGTKQAVGNAHDWAGRAWNNVRSSNSIQKAYGRFQNWRGGP